MIRFIINILIFLLIFINNTNANKISIKFKVENEIITSQDVNNELIYLRLLNNKLNNLDKKNQEQIAVNSLIQEKIKFIELQNYFDFSIKDDQMEKLINKTLKNNLRLKNKNLNDYFRQNNLDYEDIKFKIKNEILWNKLIYDKYKSRININDKDLKKKLNNLVAKRESIKEYNISEILFDINDNENVNYKYETIINSINNDGFKNTANIYSISSSSKLGGQIGWVKKTQLSEKIQNIITNLKIGEISKPIQSGPGFLIIRLENIRDIQADIDLEREFKNLRDYEIDRQLNQYSIYYFNRIKKNIFVDEL